MAVAAAWLLTPALFKTAEAAPSLRERRPASASSTPSLRAASAPRRVSQIRRAPPRRLAVGPRSAVPHRAADPVPAALEQAARATGLDGAVLHRIAERESRLDPRARSRSSSATGLMQFTRDTWLEVVRDFGPQHGLRSEAAALSTDREGRIEARNPRTLRRVLLLRENARYAAILAAERLRAARPGLEQTLERAATPADLYLVHLLGTTGARRFVTALRATPQRSSLAVLGEPARANPGVFERGGHSLPVERAYAELGRMFEGPVQLAVTRWPDLD